MTAFLAIQLVLWVSLAGLSFFFMSVNAVDGVPTWNRPLGFVFVASVGLLYWTAYLILKSG